jgi:hypothetical protein
LKQEVKMTRTHLISAVLAAALAAGCATKKGFEKPGFAFGCPIGETKVGSMEDLVRAKTLSEGRRTTIQATEMRCSRRATCEPTPTEQRQQERKRTPKFCWIDRRHARLGRSRPLMITRAPISHQHHSPPTRQDFRLILRSEE